MCNIGYDAHFECDQAQIESIMEKVLSFASNGISSYIDFIFQNDGLSLRCGEETSFYGQG